MTFIDPVYFIIIALIINIVILVFSIFGLLFNNHFNRGLAVLSIGSIINALIINIFNATTESAWGLSLFVALPLYPLWLTTIIMLIIMMLKSKPTHRSIKTLAGLSLVINVVTAYFFFSQFFPL
jgi:hypothetical protein